MFVILLFRRPSPDIFLPLSPLLLMLSYAELFPPSCKLFAASFDNLCSWFCYSRALRLSLFPLHFYFLLFPSIPLPSLFFVISFSSCYLLKLLIICIRGFVIPTPFVCPYSLSPFTSYSFPASPFPHFLS